MKFVFGYDSNDVYIYIDYILTVKVNRPVHRSFYVRYNRQCRNLWFIKTKEKAFFLSTLCSGAVRILVDFFFQCDQKCNIHNQNTNINTLANTVYRSYVCVMYDIGMNAKKDFDAIVFLIKLYAGIECMFVIWRILHIDTTWKKGLSKKYTIFQ